MIGPTLDELKAAFDQQRRPQASTATRASLPRRTVAALATLPAVTPEVAAALDLGLTPALAAENGDFSFENGRFRLAAPITELTRIGGWTDDVVALGEAVARHVATLPAEEAPRWAALARWAELARRVAAPEAFAHRLAEAAVQPGGVRWIEAARSLERLLGGRLRLGVLRAARARLLADRRADDDAHLRHFVPPATALSAFDALWQHGGALHLLGDGGTGKTTFIRHLTAHVVPGRGGVVARLDFDHLDPDYPERDPGLLVAHLAEELLLQAESEVAESDLAAVGKLADGVRERLSGSLGTTEAEIAQILEVFAEAVRAFQRPVVLIFDTCEELARRRADGRVSRAVEETLRRAEDLLARCPTLRIVFSGRWPLPPRPWLRVVPVLGFAADDAQTYLERRAAGCRSVPAYAADAALRARLVALAQLPPAPAAPDEAHFSPFELNWLAGWVEAEPAIQAADLAYAPVDRYVEMRILARLRDGRVHPLLPAVAHLGRFDAELLAAALPRPLTHYDEAFDELTRQEWVERSGDLFEVGERLRARLAAFFGPTGRDEAAAALRYRLTKAPWDTVDPILAAAWLRLEKPFDSTTWDALVGRVEAAGKWGFLVRVAELSGEAPPLVRADGLAAERWLGRPVGPGAWSRVPAESPRLALLVAAGEVVADPRDAGRRGTLAAAVQAADPGLRADGRVAAAVAAALVAVAEAHPDGLLDRRVLAAADAFSVGELGPFVRATLGHLCWLAGDRAEAMSHWRMVPASPAPGAQHLYLAGVDHLEARTRIEVRRGLWPACVPAAEAFSAVAPPEGGGPDLDRLKSLKIRAFGVSRMPRTVFDQVVENPRLPEPPRSAAHRALDPWVVSFLEESALARPERLPAALATLARLRDEALRRTDALAVVYALSAAGARLTRAARAADTHGFGQAFTTAGTAESVAQVRALELWTGAAFEQVYAPLDVPEVVHAWWRSSRDGHDAIQALERHWSRGPDLQLDAWEASRLELTAEDITLHVPDDPWTPAITLGRAVRAHALGARPARQAADRAIARLGGRLAGRIVLDEAEHLALRLPALALELFEQAATLFAKENDAFGVLRARLGQALAGMAADDDDAVCDAKQGVKVTELTPPGWRQRAELMHAWLADGGEVGPSTRRVLAAWQGPRDPLLGRIEAARGPAWLHFDHPDGVAQVVRVGHRRPVEIGRHPDCAISVPLPTLSRRHARVRFDEGMYWVEDLGSTSGTFVGDRQVTRAPLTEGTRIRCGGLTLRFSFRSEDPASSHAHPARDPRRPAAVSQAPRPGPVPAAVPSLDDLYQAALEADLAEADRRPLLMSGLPAAFVASLRRFGRPADQLHSDLAELSRTSTLTGHPEPPLDTWLRNAARLAALRPEAEIFQRALAAPRGPAPVAYGVARLHLEVDGGDRLVFARLDQHIEVRWRLDGAGMDARGVETVARPLAADHPPSPGLLEAARQLRATGPSARLAPGPGAEIYPWEALLGAGRWLPVVRTGGSLELPGTFQTAPGGAAPPIPTPTLWVVGEDPDVLAFARAAWRRGQGLTHAELVASPRRPDWLHLLAWPAEVGTEIRLAFSREAEEMVQQTRSGADYLSAAELAGPAPPRLCVLQLPPLREGSGGRWVRYQAAMLRTFARNLGQLGTTWVVVVPAVGLALADEVLGRLARLPAFPSSGELMDALAQADAHTPGALRDACLVGPD